MTSSGIDKRLATAVTVEPDDQGLMVRLSDGRSLRVLYADFRFLREAKPEQRKACVVDDKGTVLWWEPLMEGISLAGLLGVSETELEDFAGVYR